MPKTSSSPKLRPKARGKAPRRKARSVARPLAALALAAVVALAAAFYLQRRQTGTKASATPEPSSNPPSLISPEGWSKGNSTAKAVLVEFGDFQCGACASASARLARITERHGSRLKVVFKHHPMQRTHSNAMMAAQAAEAAGRQFKFWEMHDLLFERQNDWAKVPDAHTFFLQYASELQLDLGQFRRDLWNSEVRNKIYRDIVEGEMAKVRSVPAFFLNGKPIPNSRDEVEFEQRIVDGIRSVQ